MNAWLRLAGAFAALWLAGAAAAADSPRLFDSEAPLAVTLEAPWGTILRKTSDRRQRPAVLSYADAQGAQRRIELSLQTRGLTRLRYCDFPPLRIRFAKGVAKGTLFAGQGSLKLVTHCRKGGAYAQYLALELLAYRIYALSSPASFRVRPLLVSYLEPGSNASVEPRLAFLIEDIDDVAKRNGRQRDRAANFAPGDFDALAMSRLMLFQYLIGNTDFAVLTGPRKDECCHNIRVLGPGPAGGRIAVPYDFDSSGFVDAVYAAPHEDLPIRKVSERLYRGFCAHNGALAAARAEFLAGREAVRALVAGESRLDEPRRQKALRYLDGFYATLASDTQFASEISAQCRK